jgi:hypothetical protein
MTEFNRRLRRVKAKLSLRLVSGMSSKVRRILTDRAVLNGDQDALSGRSACRRWPLQGRTSSDAAVAAALRADG